MILVKLPVRWGPTTQGEAWSHGGGSLSSQRERGSERIVKQGQGGMAQLDEKLAEQKEKSYGWSIGGGGGGDEVYL